MVLVHVLCKTVRNKVTVTAMSFQEEVFLAITSCIVLYCIALHCIALHCMHCIALYCIVLYCTMRPYTEGRLDRYRIGIPWKLYEIRIQPWLS